MGGLREIGALSSSPFYFYCATILQFISIQ